MFNNMVSDSDLRNNYGMFIDSCYVNEKGYKLTKKSDISPYALCFAIFGKYLIGDDIFLERNKNLFNNLLRSNIVKKREECKKNLCLSKPYLQLLTFTLSALKVLDTLEFDPLKDLTLEIISNDLIINLKNSGTYEGSPGTGNLAMFYGILLIHANEYLKINTSLEINLWVKHHIENMNINGFWGHANSKPYLQFQNGYHQYEVFDYLETQINIDSTKIIVQLADKLGHFAPYPGGGSCYDYDAIYMLTRDSSMHNKKLLEKTLFSIINSRNFDYGFSESQFIRPLNANNLFAIIHHVSLSNKFSFYERARICLALFRPKNNRISNHWTNYSREWSESNLWDSWFRMLAVARIRIYKNIDTIDNWGFINFPGIGYHKDLKEI